MLLLWLNSPCYIPSPRQNQSHPGSISSVQVLERKFRCGSSAAILYSCWAESYPTCWSSNGKNKFWVFFVLRQKKPKVQICSGTLIRSKSSQTWAQNSSDKSLQYLLAGWWQGCPLLLKLQGMQKRNPRAAQGNQNKRVEILLSSSRRKKILPGLWLLLPFLRSETVLGAMQKVASCSKVCGAHGKPLRLSSYQTQISHFLVNFESNISKARTPTFPVCSSSQLLLQRLLLL